MKKILFIFMLLIPGVVLANSISNIDMDIYVDNNGTAHIIEKWNAYLNEGTEGYKPYYNLGTSSISNFKVSMNGKDYTFNSNYNTNASFSMKKYTNGFNYVDDGVELCFGISEYGNNIYTLSYDISNFVVNTSDGYQMIYWTLFPKNYNLNPEKVKIKIYSDFSYNASLPVWGYGKYGAPIYVSGGSIIMDSNDKVKKNEYLTILVRFDKNTFNVSTTVDKSFSGYLEMANKGTTPFKPKNNITFSQILYIIGMLFKTLFVTILQYIVSYPILCILLVCIYFFNSKAWYKKKPYGIMKMKFSFLGRFLGNTSYNRELPFKDEEISRVYWIASYYGMMKNTNDYLGAVLIKWLKRGNISINNDIIILNNDNNLDKRELELYELLKSASANNMLNEKLFKKWCKDNYEKMFRWFSDVIDDETIKLIREGKLVRLGNKYVCHVNDITKIEASSVKGVKNFLKEFSNMKDRYPMEVNLWDEYLMYATIFGISKKVIKNFNYLYPEMATDDLITACDTFGRIVHNGMNVAMIYRRKAEREYREFSSTGGGGFSSSGGGGGSFGGGSRGGGGFR